MGMKENQLIKMKNKIIKYDDLAEIIVQQMMEFIRVFDDEKNRGNL